MPEYREVPLTSLTPPDRPMREETLWEGLSDLKESLASTGLINPISVRERSPGAYQIIAGMRRTLAAKELGWQTISAKVYAKGEGTDDEIMAHENFHRTNLNPVEEALYHSEQMAKHQINVAEQARRSRRSEHTVRALLSLLEGDEGVREAVRAGKLSQAQAREINLIKDSPGRTFALTYATNNGWTALSLRLWREQRDISGISQQLGDLVPIIEGLPKPTIEERMLCSLCSLYHPINVVRIWQVCDSCQSGVAAAVEHWQATHPEEVGSGNGEG